MGVAIVVVLSCSSHYAAHAAGVFADDPCDPLYYESLESRAWLEAQREITQNQNLIFKPDSVLEYTCFDKFLEEIVDHGGPAGADKLFTGNTRWGAPASNLPASVNALVTSAVDAYDTANFNHPLLGGRKIGDAVDMPASVGPGSYACDVMNRVWLHAKCMNFVDNPDEDGFFTFAEYAADPDKRHLPVRCEGGPFAGGKTADFDTPLAVALLTPDTPWEEDPVITYYDLIYPPTGAACGGQYSRVMTGLIVERTDGPVNLYQEHVCIVPGCHYVPSSFSGGSCTQ